VALRLRDDIQALEELSEVTQAPLFSGNHPQKNVIFLGLKSMVTWALQFSRKIRKPNLKTNGLRFKTSKPETMHGFYDQYQM
jgi:hypothetical protein